MSADTYEDRSDGYGHDKIQLASNTKNDPDSILSTLPLLICPFCMFATPIEFDIDLHLYEEHKNQLMKRFPGYDINSILEYVLMQLTAAAGVRGRG